jgi:hypothetical protein
MWIRRFAVTVLVPMAVAAALGAAPTFGVESGASSITAHPSDPTPQLGGEFVIRGQYLDHGGSAVDHAVKVQTYRKGEWLNIAGAKVATDSEGRYRVRVVLFVRGVRDLRVVGIGDGDRTYHRLVVEVR